MTEICVEISATVDEIKKVAIEKGFEFLETYYNLDTYYTTLKNEELKNVSYLNLLDNSVVIRDVFGDTWAVKNIVHKKKTLDENQNVIEEIKTEIKIDDIAKAKKLFDNLKMTCWCDFTNQNTLLKKGEVILNVQYIKELGTFIEVEEYDSIADYPATQKFDILVDIINSLGFPIGTDYSCKKPFMLFEKNQKNMI